jgi:Flp pilus assembly protein TadG
MRNIFRRPKKRFSWNAWPLGRLPLWKDQRGSIAVMTAVFLLFLTGILGFAIDAGSWAVAKRALQGAADGAAYSAAMAYNDNNNNTAIIVTQAEGITAAQGYVGGASTLNSTGVQNATTLVTVTVNHPPKSGPNTTDQTAVEVIVQQPQPRFFSGFYQAANPVVAARAVAAKPPGSGNGCVLALNNGGANAGTITVHGTGDLNAPNCDIAANGTTTTPIAMNGKNALITTPCAATAGGSPGDTGTGTLDLTKCTSVTTGSPTTDPYAAVPPPAAPTAPTAPIGSCLPDPNYTTGTHTLAAGNYCKITISGGTITVSPGVNSLGAITISGTATVTVSAGVNPNSFGGIAIFGGTVTFSAGVNSFGGIAISGGTVTFSADVNSIGGIAISGGTVTFSAGVNSFGPIAISGGTTTFSGGPTPYYINGNFSISGGATVTGTNVTFFIKAPGYLTITGNGNTTFTAPTSGTYKGIVFFGDRAGTVATTNQIAGTVNVSITGAMYFPNETFSDLGTSSTASVCTQVVADVVDIGGTPTFNSNCAGTGITNINVSEPGLVKLIE